LFKIIVLILSNPGARADIRKTSYNNLSANLKARVR
jgi:hypothetical protein